MTIPTVSVLGSGFDVEKYLVTAGIRRLRHHTGVREARGFGIL